MYTADIVVIGGGVLGGAVAFYLAKQAAGRVVVLERHAAVQGNSSLAAGLLTRGRFQPHLIPLVLETYRAIQDIEALTGESLGMRPCGCLYAASSPEQQKKLGDLTAVARQAGLRVTRLDAAEAARLVPWLKLPADCSVIFMPDDGYIDGYTLASGYLKGARLAGVEIFEQTEVRSIVKQGPRVSGVKTNRGEFSAARVVDAAGVWAGLLALELGIRLPMAPVRSHYWITASHRGFAPQHPMIILPEARAYARPEANRLLFGFREAQSVAVNPRDLPEHMTGYIFQQDPNGWEALLEGIPGFRGFCPQIEEIGVAHYVKGLSNYTPDGNFVLGAFSAVTGFLAATGCAGAGIAMSAGIGRLVAELAANHAPFVDPTPHRIERFEEIDPLNPAFIQKCADARSGKITG